MGLYITTYFGYGQCFISEFIVLAFIETARLDTTSFSNFSWSGNEVFWSVNYIRQVCKLKLVLKVLDNVFLDRFLLVAFVKYILWQICSHCIQNCTFLILCRECGNFCSLKKIFSESSYIYVLFYPKTSNFHNSGIIGRRRCLTPQWKTYLMFCRFFYNMHSFKWHDISLKCLFTITPKGQFLRFKPSVWNISMSETGRNCNSLFKLVDNNWVVIMEQKRRMEYNWACTIQSSHGFNRFQDFLGWRKISF